MRMPRLTAAWLNESAADRVAALAIASAISLRDATPYGTHVAQGLPACVPRSTYASQRFHSRPGRRRRRRADPAAQAESQAETDRDRRRLRARRPVRRDLPARRQARHRRLRFARAAGLADAEEIRPGPDDVSAGPRRHDSRRAQ